MRKVECERQKAEGRRQKAEGGIQARQQRGFVPASIRINPKKENNETRKWQKVDLTLMLELLIFKCRKGVAPG